MCLRALLYVFTSLLLAFSLVLVAAGLWLTIDEDSMVQVVNDLLNATNAQEGLSDLPRLEVILIQVTTINFLNVILIAIGGVVFFVAFSGLCGTRKDSPRLLLTFAFFTIVFLALQIALVIHLNQDGDILVDVWKRFNIPKNATERIVNIVDTPSENISSSPILLPTASIFIQSGLCSFLPGVLSLARWLTLFSLKMICSICLFIFVYIYCKYISHLQPYSRLYSGQEEGARIYRHIPGRVLEGYFVI